jgi:hypothetical protein
MIDENFVQAAIQIKKEYLKVTNTLGVYQKKAKETTSEMDKIIIKLEELQEKAKNNKQMTTEMAMTDIEKIIKEFEEQAKRLTSVIDPLNEQLEKLALEEEELWRMIKNKHSDLEDYQIISYVQNRLTKENLS